MLQHQRDRYVGRRGRRHRGAAYGEAKFERLRQVKRRFDPHNRFRYNHDIPPAEGRPRR